MVFIPLVAAAGYAYYKKKKAQREAEEHANQNAEGEASDDRDTPADDKSVPSDIGSTPTSSPRADASSGKPTGPMGKFLQFCENLEKEVQKAQERKRNLVIVDAFEKNHRGGSKSSLDTEVCSQIEKIEAIQELTLPKPMEHATPMRPRITTE